MIFFPSTCTITLGENEEVAAWALEEFAGTLELSDASSAACGIGQPGIPVPGLEDPAELNKVLRFFRCPAGDSPGEDTIGFFIAKFKKRRE